MAPRMIHIALVSCPGIGHIKPLLSLGDEIVKAHDDIVVTVFGILTDEQLKKLRIHTTCERVHFHHLADQFGSLPFDPRYEQNAPQYVSDMVAYVDSHHLPPPVCHIYDMFVGWSKLLADTYKIPSYLFMPCSLRASSLLFFTPPLDDDEKDPAVLAERELEKKMRAEMYTLMTPQTTAFFEAHVKKWKDGDGMLVNDVIELSSSLVVEKIRTSCVRQPYRIYTIGPVGLDPSVEAANATYDENIEWLDGHCANSVIYVALGSWCELPLQDVCELAFALRSLTVPVLWAYRGPDPEAKKEFWISDRELTDEVDSDGLPLYYRESLSPSTFRIVKWVDQRRVLQHPSLRMFVSHCGWNSTIEALTLMGKPIAALPVGAEQGCNAIDIEFSFKVGKRLWNCSRERKLDRTEVEARLREILQEPRFLENAQRARSLIKEAKAVDGSSVQNMHKYLGALLATTTSASP